MDTSIFKAFIRQVELLLVLIGNSVLIFEFSNTIPIHNG